MRGNREKLDLKKAFLIIIYMVALFRYGLKEFNINYLFGFINPIYYMFILSKEECFNEKESTSTTNIFYILVVIGFICIIGV